MLKNRIELTFRNRSIIPFVGHGIESWDRVGIDSIFFCLFYNICWKGMNLIWNKRYLLIVMGI